MLDTNLRYTLQISKKDLSSVRFLGGKDLQMASQILSSAASFSGRILCPRYDTVMSKKENIDNVGFTTAFRSRVITVRTCTRCPGTDFD